VILRDTKPLLDRICKPQDWRNRMDSCLASSEQGKEKEDVDR
jgi:hypothetical protein